MRIRHTDPNLGRAGAYPALEALEDRTCPSSITLQGHTLLIDGNNTSDTITVSDGGHGNVTASVRDSAGHTLTKSVQGVQAIQINSLGGDDKVHYALTGALTTSEQLSVNLGNGTDQANLDFSKGVSAPKSTVRVQGGSGDDTLHATFGAIKNTNVDFRSTLGGGNDQVFANFNGALTGTAHVLFQATDGSGYDGINVGVKSNIAATASLDVEAIGGANPGTMHVDYQGQDNGKLTIHEQGGPQFSWLESDITLNAGSTGNLVANVDGGQGDDVLILRVHDNSHHMHSLLATLNGGGGQNQGVATANVKVLHASLG